MSQTLEAESAFSGAEQPSRYRTRRRIDKKGILCTHHTRPLNSLKNVLSECARVYRATINGDITAIEGVRLSFILREVRSALEAVNAEEVRIADAEAARVVAQEAAKPYVPPQLNIISVPSGHSILGDGSHVVPNNEARVPQLEHHQEAITPLESSAFVPKNPEEVQLLAELESLSYAQLLERAQRSGLVDVAPE